MLAWAIGGVVSVLLIKQLKRLLLVQIPWLFGQERPHSPRILVSQCCEQCCYSGAPLAG
jgi:hypothetical protein